MKARSHPVIELKDSSLLMPAVALTSLLIAFLIARVNLLVSPIVLVVVVGFPFMVASFNDYRWAFYGGLIFTSIMFYFERIVPADMPYGVVCDLLFALAFFALLFDSRYTGWRKKLLHPLVIGYLVIFIYQTLQVFNPNAVSLAGWSFSLRTWVFPLIMFTCMALFERESGIRMLLNTWITLGLLAGVYGLYQEFAGLTDFEWNWVMADPIRYRLYYIQGHMRVFSFLSDPAAFGVFMAYTSLAALCLMLGPVSGIKRVYLGVSLMIMLLAMIYSGTRTAYAMLMAGVVLLVLMSIRKRSTLIFSFIGVMVFVALMFGPFYSAPVMRFRSAFKPNEDASMEVRDVKRVNLQPYIQSHPVGGGLNTTGAPGLRFSPGHWLAGGWDPDSGYLKVALEQGWIGLLILLAYFFLVMVRGINNYFKLEDPMYKHYNLAYLVPFFAASIAYYTQYAVLFKPIYVIIIATFALIISLESIVHKKSKFSQS